jgi:hypothetical protein
LGLAECKERKYDFFFPKEGCVSSAKQRKRFDEENDGFEMLNLRYFTPHIT